jgi:hypothetical protein
MSSTSRAADVGPAALQRLDHLARVVQAQRGLRHVGHARLRRDRQPRDVGRRRHQVHRRVDRADGALHLLVAGMADHHQREAQPRVTLQLQVHLGDERAGGVDRAQATRLRLAHHLARDAMGAEDHRRAVRDVVDRVDEHGAAGAEARDHVRVVHDLVEDVHRRPVQPQGALDRLDRAHDAGAEAARLRQQQFHRAAPRRRSAPITRRR